MRKILIVDDDPNVVSYIKAVMETQAEFAVREAFDGIEGLEAAFVHPPDLAIVDITMPGRDGLSVLRLLKRDRRTAHTKVIIMTGVPSDTAHSNAVKLGADGWMAKPFSPRQILEQVAEAMNVDLALV